MTGLRKRAKGFFHNPPEPIFGRLMIESSPSKTISAERTPAKMGVATPHPRHPPRSSLTTLHGRRQPQDGIVLTKLTMPIQSSLTPFGNDRAATSSIDPAESTY